MQDLLNFQAILATLRRLWWLPLMTLIAGFGVSAWLCRTLPKMYQAGSLIIVEQPKVPSSYVRAVVAAPIDSRIKTLHQRILSNNALAPVVDESEAFAKLRERVPREWLVGRVNLSVRVELRGPRSFKVFCEDESPEIAAAVANKAAQMFVLEHASLRRAEAGITTTFLDEQLQAKKAELERQEAFITEFNRTHLAELPVQRDLNFQMLQGFRTRLQTNMDAISKEQDRKIVLETQLAEIPASGVSNVLAAATELDKQRQRLIELLSQYTEQHPEVTLTRRQIAQLEEQLRRQAAERDAIQPAPPPPAAVSLREQQIRAQLGEIELRLREYARESERLKNLISEYEARVANAPKNEQTLLTLKRDYDILQQSYLELLKNKSQAQMAESLELEQQGEQYIVLEEAVVPGSPFKPNLVQIMAFGCALGLVTGLGLAILVDLIRPRFRSEDDLLVAYGIPVLATIPQMMLPGDGEKAGGLAASMEMASRFFRRRRRGAA